MKLQTILCTLLLATGAGLAQAQNLKPGLWEMSTQMQGGAAGSADAMSKMQSEMAKLPPEQRKMMEDMMAKQGMQMGAAAGGGMAIKLCLTQEMVERNEMAKQQGDCTHTSSPRSAKTMKFTFVCTKPPSSGEGEVTFSSPEAYSSRVSVTSTARGKPEKTDIQSSGRWLGADCGNVKPLAVPRGG